MKKTTIQVSEETAKKLQEIKLENDLSNVEAVLKRILNKDKALKW